MKYLDRLPDHMRQGVRDYIEYGLPPGGFLGAVLSNQLAEAFARADSINRAAMGDWAAWLWDEAPNECWGSPATVNAWCEARQAASEEASRVEPV